MLTQVAELERERDAVVETEASDKASKMIQQLTGLRRHRCSERDRSGARSPAATE